MKYFISVIAMVLIIEGLPYFTFPQKMKNILKIISNVDSKELRIMGLTLIIIGLILLHFFK